MSYVREKSFFEKLKLIRSIKGFGFFYLKKLMIGQKILLFNKKLPKVVNISFNEKTCMFSCKMCPYSGEEVRDLYRNRSEMDFETLQSLVKSIPNDPFYSFDISAIGETLEFKPIAEFVAFMKKEKPLVNTIISTNGVLLNEKMFRDLVHAGLDNLQISLFAENKDDHQMITGSKSFDQVCSNIKKISEIKKSMNAKNPFIQVFMMSSKETEKHIEQFEKYWAKYVDKAFVRPIYNLGRQIEGMTPCFEAKRSPKRYPCIIPWYSTAINSKGDILPCYMYHWHKEGKDETLGNINDQTLEEIWKSPKFLKFREAHINSDFSEYPICEKCDLWDAYTNIWKEKTDGSFTLDKINLLDFIRKAPDHRGG